MDYGVKIIIFESQSNKVSEFQLFRFDFVFIKSTMAENIQKTSNMKNKNKNWPEKYKINFDRNLHN